MVMPTFFVATKVGLDRAGVNRYLEHSNQIIKCQIMTII